jgi:hypothetical protein
MRYSPTFGVVWNSANFASIDFSEVPRRPSEELVHSPVTLHPEREYVPDVTNKAGGVRHFYPSRREKNR